MRGQGDDILTSIVNSVVYRDGKRIGDIAVNDIGEAIRQAGTFVWLGMHGPDDSQLLRIQQEFGLRELAIEAATALGYQVERTYDDAAMFGLV